MIEMYPKNKNPINHAPKLTSNYSFERLFMIKKYDPRKRKN